MVTPSITASIGTTEKYVNVSGMMNSCRPP